MIVYAIKHKDGKFWQFLHNNKSEFVDDIYNAFFYYSKHDATICSWGLKDCKVVKVTIVEGDLEQQLAKKDNEINNLKELRKFEIEDKKELRENQLQEIIKLEKELAEKDKEIEEYKTQIKEFCGTKLVKLIDKKEQEIRKQVCDEIRNAIEVAKLRYMWEGKSLEISKILDKTEKGE